MGELRPGWKRVRLGDVVDVITDYWDRDSSKPERFVAGEHVDEGELRVRRWGMTDDELVPPTFNRRFKAGDVLFHSRNLRKLACPDFNGITGEKLFVLRSRDERVLLQGLLPFLLQTGAFSEYTERMWAGSTNKFLNKAPLVRYEFALPPLKEQQRIASLLHAQRDVMDSYAALVDAASTTRRALGKQFFISAPEGRQSTVGAFAAVRNGTTPRRNVDDYWGGTIPWLPTGKVNERRITAADEFITEKALEECSLGGILPVGSCLVAMIGEGVTRGKVARLELPACINQNFAAVVPGEDIDSWYLFYYLESHYESLRRWSQGTNQQALNCSLVRAFPIFVPTLARQREIANLLREVDERYLLATMRLEEARGQLRQSSTNLSQGQA